MGNIIEITDLAAPELEVYARLNEAQLLHSCEPDRGIFIAESPKVIERAIQGGCQPLSVLAEKRKLLEQAGELLERFPQIPVYTAELEVLTGLTGFGFARGLLCAMKRPSLPPLAQVCRKARRVAVLEQVVNPTNVGAIFRSAAALNMDAILLTKGCSDPLYRRAIRVSMGTVFQIPWTFFDRSLSWPKEGLELLKGLGFKTAAMALSDQSVPIDDPGLLGEEKLAVVLGTEGDGLAKSTMAGCDYTVRIPMSHGVDSLNVAAASAVAFWQLGRRDEALRP